VKSHTTGISLFCFLLLFNLTTYSQPDSLKKLLDKATHDTTRCKLLNQLVESENNDAVWPQYNDQIEVIADKNLKNPGALKNFFLQYKAIVFNNRGYLAFYHGENEKAIQFYEEALAIQKKIAHKPGIAASLYNLGDLYMNQGDVGKALEYLLNSLDLHEQLKDSVGTAYVLNDLGWQYYVQGEHDHARTYLEKALSFRKRLGDKRGLANTYNSLGLIAKDKNEYDKAMEYFGKTLQLMKESGDMQGMGLALNSIGSIYQGRADLSMALKYYQDAAEIQLKIGDKNGWITSNTNAATVTFAMAKGDRKKIEQALRMCHQSLDEARAMGFPSEIKSAALTLDQIYKSLGNYQKAYEFHDLYYRMRDSVANVETRKASIKRQFQYQYEKKAAADSVRNQEAQKVKDAQLNAQQAQLKQEKTQRYALYGGLALVILFGIFIFNRFRITQRQKAIIEAQKKQVDKAYESLHEKNKEVMDSIYYARRIQKALITSEKYVGRQMERLRR